MRKSDIIIESTSTSEQNNSKVDMSRYGKLEDPRKIKTSAEYADDGAGFSIDYMDKTKRKADPRYVDVIKEEKKIKKWALDNGKLFSPSGNNKYVETPINATTKKKKNR